MSNGYDTESYDGFGNPYESSGDDEAYVRDWRTGQVRYVPGSYRPRRRSATPPPGAGWQPG